VLIVVGWLWIAIQFALFVINMIYQTFKSDIVNSFSAEIPSAIISVLSVINYVLPLVELLTYMVAYGGVLATMAIYRHLKSLVPNVVSGGT